MARGDEQHRTGGHAPGPAQVAQGLLDEKADHDYPSSLTSRPDSRVSVRRRSWRGQAGLMRGEQYRGPARPDVPDHPEDLAGHVVVQVARRLVGQEEGRLATMARASAAR